MKGASTWALLMLVGVLPLRAADELKPKEQSPYFPLEKGKSWTYKSGEKTITLKVADFEKSGDDICARLEWRRDKDLISTELVGLRKDGIYRFQQGGADIRTPLRFLKFSGDDPARPDKGADWELKDVKIGSDEIKGSFRMGDEKIKLGAKEYNAITVESFGMTVGDKNPLVVKYWFVKDKGLVKSTVQIGGKTTELILQEDAK